MSSGSIIQGMFSLQPTSKWMGRSDSWDETLDRTNPPWLYHPGFLQIFHAPKGAQNIFLTWVIENSISVTYLYSKGLFRWNVNTDHYSCSFTTVYALSELLNGIDLLFFLFSGHLRPPVDIRNGCFTLACLLIIGAFSDTPNHHLWWCPWWQSATFRGIQHQLYSSLSERWLTDHTPLCM